MPARLGVEAAEAQCLRRRSTRRVRAAAPPSDRRPRPPRGGRTEPPLNPGRFTPAIRQLRQRQGPRFSLFFGCRTPLTDQLDADELRDYEQQNLVRVEYAFSREPGQPGRYVQEALLDCADEVWDLLQEGAVVLVCGNAATIAPGVRRSLLHIFRERTSTTGSDAEAWLDGLR
jgi:hypothetical protein